MVGEEGGCRLLGVAQVLTGEVAGRAGSTQGAVRARGEAGDRAAW